MADKNKKNHTEECPDELHLHNDDGSIEVTNEISGDEETITLDQSSGDELVEKAVTDFAGGLIKCSGGVEILKRPCPNIGNWVVRRKNRDGEIVLDYCCKAHIGIAASHLGFEEIK